MTFNGMMNVNLIGVNSVLRKVDLVGVVGTVNLVVKPPTSKLQLTNGEFKKLHKKKMYNGGHIRLIIVCC